MKISVIILTYNRRELLERLISSLLELRNVHEIIIVDNGSGGELDCSRYCKKLVYIKMESNLGVAARNIGMLQATGDILVTLDDDVSDITDSSLEFIRWRFYSSTSLGAINFKVVGPEHGEVVNWCHHRDPAKFADHEFETYEISEGAVAFRAETLRKAGYYPTLFFISHEGIDLACRILKSGYQVRYCPQVKVVHTHSDIGRSSWRRYYYDTRNSIWFVVRNYPFDMLIRHLVLNLGSMFLYALRDGYIQYWFKAIFDGIVGLPAAIHERAVIPPEVRAKIRAINRYQVGHCTMVKKRLFKRGIRI